MTRPPTDSRAKGELARSVRRVARRVAYFAVDSIGILVDVGYAARDRVRNGRSARAGRAARVRRRRT